MRMLTFIFRCTVLPVVRRKKRVFLSLKVDLIVLTKNTTTMAIPEHQGMREPLSSRATDSDPPSFVENQKKVDLIVLTKNTTTMAQEGHDSEVALRVFDLEFFLFCKNVA
jgi:hypothetical protein